MEFLQIGLLRVGWFPRVFGKESRPRILRSGQQAEARQRGAGAPCRAELVRNYERARREKNLDLTMQVSFRNMTDKYRDFAGLLDGVTRRVTRCLDPAKDFSSQHRITQILVVPRTHGNLACGAEVVE